MLNRVPQYTRTERRLWKILLHKEEITEARLNSSKNKYDIAKREPTTESVGTECVLLFDVAMSNERQT